MQIGVTLVVVAIFEAWFKSRWGHRKFPTTSRSFGACNGGVTSGGRALRASLSRPPLNASIVSQTDGDGPMNVGEWPESVNAARIPYELAIEELAALASGPAPQRWPAFYAIGRVGTEHALELLSAFARDRDPNVRRTAVEVLGHLPTRSQTKALLLDALLDTDGPVVRTACGIAGDGRLEDARPILRRLATAADLHTRIAAVQALAAIGHRDDIDVAESLMEVNDEAGRKAGAFACRSLVSESSWRRLARVWLSDSVSRHRVWAAELLGDFGGPEDDLALEKLAVDGDGHVREAARRAGVVIRGRVG
jgi:HEAT repeat protein